MEIPHFDVLLQQQRAGRQVPARLLALDPGETTGWALFIDGQLADVGQVATTSVGVIWDLVETIAPTAVVAESYRIYAHKLAEHRGSDVPTLRIIGAIELTCWLRDLPAPKLQSAAQAKGFCTDDKLRAWSMYQSGKRHANDAIRHGCYALLFG